MHDEHEAPNTRPVTYKDHVVFKALRDQEPGEEIRYNYGQERYETGICGGNDTQV